MRWRRVGVALLALLAAGCGGDVDPVTRTAEKMYEVSRPVRTVTVDARVASVTVETGSGPIAVQERLWYTTTKPATAHRVDGTTLVLAETGCGDRVRLRCKVEYELHVPAATAVQVTTRAGAVTVHGLAGALTVSTDAGAVNGQMLTADQVTVTTRAGAAKLQFADAPALVKAATDLGAIEVRVPGNRSYAVDISAKVGASDVSVRRDAGSPHRISVQTDVGAVRVAPT